MITPPRTKMAKAGGVKGSPRIDKRMILWKPIAGEREELDSTRITKQIGKKFSIEDLLPPKERPPSTTEGKQSKSNYT